jgi:hypothetical protein
VGLAGPVHGATHVREEVGNCTCAVEQCSADVDDKVGIGTNERQPQRQRLFEQPAIVVGLFATIVIQPGADDGFGVAERNRPRFQRSKQRLVAILRANAVEPRKAALLDMCERDIARRDDIVPGGLGHMAAFKHIGNALLRHRCVRDEDDGATAGTKSFECPAGIFERCNAVMHDTPDVAENNSVALKKRSGVR